MASKKKSSSEILADYFANSAWRSADEAKRLRTRSRAAASTCKEVLGITNHLPPSDQAALADDITALKRAFEILDQMGAAFELAQRVAKNAEAKRDADRKAEREAQVTRMVAELFGTNPAPKAVAAIAADLAEFDRQLGDYVKVHRNTDRGLIDNGSTCEIPNLAHYAKTKETNELARLVAIAWSGMSAKGHLYQSSSSSNCWFAGQDDFIAWRNWRDGVSATLSEIGKKQPS